MKSIIQFRGKCLESGEWRYGTLSLTNNRTLAFINNTSVNASNAYAFTYEVDINTIGQYTGKKDNEGLRIYEDDIMSNKWLCVVYKDKNTGAFMVRFKPSVKNTTLHEYLKRREKAGTSNECNVVLGNIHENQELLKKQ